MNLRKTLPAFFGAAVFCLALPLLPGDAQAGTVTDIVTPKDGDTSLTVTYTDADPSDIYAIYVNDEMITMSTLDAIGVDGEITTKTFYPTGMVLHTGDRVSFYLRNDEGALVPTTVTVVADLDPVVPTSWRVSETQVTASDNASVEVSFDSAYVPHENDQILVTRYDANDQAVESYYVALPDTYTDPVALQLKSSSATAYYTLQFVPGSGAADLSTLRVNVSKNTTDPGDDPTDEPDDDQQEQIDNAVSMSFAYPSSNVSLGESVTPTIQLTDADGNSADYTGPVIFSYSGEAIVTGSFDSNGRFTVSSDQSLIGSKIQVTAMVGKFSKTVELTVQASDKSLVLSPNSGSMGNSRAITFQLADGSGNKLRLLWQPTVAEVSIKPKDPNSTARMAGTVTNLSSLTTNGSGTLLLSSDSIAAAEVSIIFRDNNGRFYETAISDFTFTEATGDEAMQIMLNIGSPIYTVNGVDNTTDTVPVVLNSRTFIPFRLLAETMGGEVVYDGTTQTITTVYGGTTIVMTIGSNTYTIDGTAHTMDVAPYVNSDNRTMVPLRVLAESLGCTVEAQYGANGTTVGVLVER